VDEKLVVSFIEPAKVEVLDNNRSVLCEISTNASCKSLFECPYYVTVVTENGHDQAYNDGQVVITYRDNDVEEPNGLTSTDDGHILVCGTSSNTVQFVSRSGTKIRTLLAKKYEIGQSQTLLYDAERKLVYVAKVSNANIVVYKVK